MLRSSIILSFLCVLYSQHVNFETGWDFNSSPSQSFYIFDSIEIDGVAALGDGWAPSETLLSDCVSNPYSCDVVGAFLDNICVGWVYADAEGFTTLPIMGASQIDGDGTASYCIQGDIPSIKIYDSSSGAVLDVVAGDAIPAWSDNIAYQISNISFANNGIIADGPNWTYFQSSNQAFYIFENIVIDDIVLEDFDIVGAFKDGLCVGWINYDTDGFTSVPVMGFEEGLYPNYMLDSEIPYFRFFDYSDQAYYNIILASEVPGWSSNSYFIIEGDTAADPDIIEGCTDVNACNYEPSATDDDGSCLYNDCAGECGGLAELDDCGVCQGDGASCLAFLQLGLFDELGSLEILYDFGGPVAGFQFDLTGLELVGASGGVANEIGMTVSIGTTTIVGFSLNNVEILAGSGILTIVSFSDVIDSQTLLTLGNFGAITDAQGNVYVTNTFGVIDHGEPDCLGDYYGDAFIDVCGQCVAGDINPDDCLSSDLGLPLDLYLSQNYPNPFNPWSIVNYGISSNGNVNISLYDLNGRKIDTFINKFHIAGHYSLTLNSDNLNSGFYLLKITSLGDSRAIKITVIK